MQPFQSVLEFPMKTFRHFLFVLLIFGVMTTLTLPVEARVRLEYICKLAGQHEIHLRGIGLVTGLAGTGDGGKNLAAIRALQQAMKNLNNPVVDLKELKDAKNFALVQIEAIIPASGIRPGQKIDCYVTSSMGAKSLKGGRLMASPLEEVGTKKGEAVGIASGSLFIEKTDIPTVGKISGGVVIKKIFPSHFLDKDSRGLPIIRLLIDRGHASFYTATEVAKAINLDFKYEEPQGIANPISPGVVEVRIPKTYYPVPVEFVSTVLAVTILNPNIQAKVVINSRTGVILISGEVEMSPTLITHPNLRIQIGNNVAGTPVSNGGFVNLSDPQNSQKSQQLKQLLDALNELKVAPKDIIDIIRELHHSGKLHAELIDE